MPACPDGQTLTMMLVWIVEDDPVFAEGVDHASEVHSSGHQSVVPKVLGHRIGCANLHSSAS